MRTTPASSNDTFSMLAAEVRRAPTERLATMTLYRAVDAWCAQQNRPPVQFLFLHVTNASSSSGHPRTYTIQTSSPLLTEIIRKGTQWADVYHTLQNKPIPTELAWDS